MFDDIPSLRDLLDRFRRGAPFLVIAALIAGTACNPEPPPIPASSPSVGGGSVAFIGPPVPPSSWLCRCEALPDLGTSPRAGRARAAR